MTLRRLERWEQELGLLPVSLWPKSQGKSPYVLLNGSRGNFCLDFSGQRPGQTSRNEAWSANVAHYVSIASEEVFVQRWDQVDPHVVGRNQVDKDLERFHSRLEEKEPDRSSSVIAHNLRLFGRLRALLGPEVTGQHALGGFLVLLACATDRVPRNELALQKWQISSKHLDIVDRVELTDWEKLVHDLTEGRPVDRLKPEMRLTLRHAAGELFQEAHYAAHFYNDDQLRIEGFPPQPVDLEKTTDAIGLHFTPSPLARSVAEEALTSLDTDTDHVCIFDPACGSGEFLREAWRHLRRSGYAGRVSLIGFDISEAACDITRFSLTWEDQFLPGETDIVVRNCNSLRARQLWPDPDLIITNPPFLSWPNMSDDQQEMVAEALGPLRKGRPDYSSAFLYHCAETLASDGVLASIVPASFLDAESTAPIRERIASSLRPLLLGRLGSQSVFQAATVDVGVYIGQKMEAESVPVAIWADHRPRSMAAALRSRRRTRNRPPETSFPITDDGYSVYLAPGLGQGADSWAPRPYRQWQLLNLLSSQTQVADIFDVKQGIRTGQNSTFLLSEEDWSALPEKEQSYFRPALVNDSVFDGQVHSGTYVFYPYGRRRIDSEEELQESVPYFYEERLAAARTSLLDRSRINETNWWTLSEHRVWQESLTTKLVSSYFGDSGDFAWDEKGLFAIVQGYAWLPKTSAGRLSRKLWLAYLALLNSPIFSDLLAASSNHVGGGQWNLSSKFVEPMPLPDLSKNDIDVSVLEEAASIGDRIHTVGLSSLTSQEHGQLTEISESLFAT